MFGDVVRSHRRRLGLSQEELAARAGVSVRGLRKIEANQITSPRGATVRLLADALELSDDEHRRFRALASSARPIGRLPNRSVPEPTDGHAPAAGTTEPQPAPATKPTNGASPSAGEPATTAGGTATPGGSPGGARERAAVRGRPVPIQLPADVAGFTGRAEHVHRLTALLDRYRDHHPTAVMITAVTGSAGIGKTALAVHWAHLVRHRFPDGQLYVNLRGFDPTDAAMQPSEAILRFLDALEVPRARIPEAPESRAALYRSMLVDRRMLILLDNARDAEQVRPLLPGAPGCLVLVTSRNHLSGLVAADGAHLVALDLLSAAEAQQLLDARLGRPRTAAEPEAAEEIVFRCARLPLALVIAAARAIAHPQFPLHELAAELRDSRGRLDALAGDDPATDVRAVFSWSYRALPAEAARLLRLLGLHPGPDISIPAAASLAGVPAAQVRRALTELARAHLVVEHLPGRYTLHDLLRAYAAEQAGRFDPPEQRQAATARMLDHYLHSLHAAMLCLRRRPYAPPLAPPQPGVTPERPTDFGAALDWRNRQSAVLLAAIQHAAASGYVTHAWQMTLRFVAFVEHGPHQHDWIAPCRAALQAAQRAGDRVGQAHAHHDLARVYAVWYRYDEATEHLRQSLALFEELRDELGQAHACEGLAWVLVTTGELAAARDHAQRSLDLYRACGDLAGEANALNNLGWANIQLGEYRQAIVDCRRSLELSERLDIPNCAAYVWDSLGFAHQHLAEYEAAIECYRQALDLCSNLYQRGATYCRLGDVQRTIGDLAAAGEAYRNALVILTEIGHPEAEQARAKLGDVESRNAAGTGV